MKRLRWSEVKIHAKFCLRSSLLFSINFSISTFDITIGIIFITNYLQINIIYHKHMHAFYPQYYVQVQIGVFLLRLLFFIRLTPALHALGAFSRAIFPSFLLTLLANLFASPKPFTKTSFILFCLSCYFTLHC